jgi:hypothetical protein
VRYRDFVPDDDDSRARLLRSVMDLSAAQFPEEVRLEPGERKVVVVALAGGSDLSPDLPATLRIGDLAVPLATTRLEPGLIQLAQPAGTK